MKNLPGSVLYVSHGGGPLPLLGDEMHRELVANFRHLSEIIEKPAAIVVISAHWEEKVPTITGGANPELIYDYYGFPKESYEIQYPAPGDPKLANKIYDLLGKSGVDARLDAGRGFDHGVFVPLKIMYPDADIPCVQLSLIAGLDPVEHIRVGKALTTLLTENVLVIGSGSSFHNLRAFFLPPTEESQNRNIAFEDWLVDTCSDPNLAEQEREHRLLDWETAPAARYCHPREEHLMPVHVCYGITGSAAKQVFRFNVMNKRVSTYLW